jgi:hypothetical protein
LATMAKSQVINARRRNRLTSWTSSATVSNKLGTRQSKGCQSNMLIQQENSLRWPNWQNAGFFTNTDEQEDPDGAGRVWMVNIVQVDVSGCCELIQGCHPTPVEHSLFHSNALGII